ncbi:MAG: RNA polymerase sigma factor [Nitrospinales bacterium]
MMLQPADNELIIKAQGGDKSAFEALVCENYDLMFRIAFKWCGDQEDAEDITQNACIKLARNIDGFQFKSAFTSWLYRLVINTAIDWKRQNTRHLTQELMDDNVPDPINSEAENTFYTKQVLEKVHSLPKREKSALLLVMSEGLSHKEAASIMQCKESTISWYIHEARKKLKKFEDPSHG